MGLTVFIKIKSSASYIRTEFKLVLTLFIDSIEQSATGSFFNFFFIRQKKSNKNPCSINLVLSRCLNPTNFLEKKRRRSYGISTSYSVPYEISKKMKTSKNHKTKCCNSIVCLCRMRYQPVWVKFWVTLGFVTSRQSKCKVPIETKYRHC